MSKRTLHSFFTSPLAPKKIRLSDDASDIISSNDRNEELATTYSTHGTYPFAIADYPAELADNIKFVPAREGRQINDQPDLDLCYYEPYIPSNCHHKLFTFLRKSLPFYRVKYSIKRGSVETQIVTPRYTTVFGIDASSVFSEDKSQILDTVTKKPLPADKYKCKPRPLPACLNTLKLLTEATTGETFNFCLVNYYENGEHSISYHSDDERFLGSKPAIASFSLGAKRDFLMKHKPMAPGSDKPEAKPLKLALASGDMILMRGKTQSNWLHSIPKRKGGEGDKGRINITFRKALVRGGTENYYHYNVGTGHVFMWSEEAQQMSPCEPERPKG